MLYPILRLLKIWDSTDRTIEDWQEEYLCYCRFWNEHYDKGGTPIKLSKNMIMNKLELLTDVDKYLSKKEKIVLYGAGRVSYAFLQYVISRGMIDHIFCIIVSRMSNNPDNVLGIPVCCIDDVDLSEIDGVVISSFERYHAEILESLSKYNIQEVFVTTNILYARLRAQTQSMDADIFNNTQRI